MKITIKKKPKGYTVKTNGEVAKRLTYGEMLTKVRWELNRIQDTAIEKKKQQKFHQTLGPLSRRLTGEELISKGYLIRPPSFSPVFNKHRYDLRYFLPDGWDKVNSEFDFIAIDGNGDVYTYAKKPLVCNKSQKWDIFEFGSHFCQLTKTAIPPNVNWAHLIWERPKTTQP